MPRKPTHQQTDTLATLSDQAFVLFGRYGYEGVSISDIAKRARLSKGALYWHFSGKEALYLHCLKRLHGIFNEDIFDPMSDADDGVLAMLTMFRGLSRLFADPRIQQGIAGYWLIPDTPETAAIITTQRAFETDSVRVIESCLRRGVAQGRFEMGGDLEDMARAIISLIEAMVLPMRHLAPDEIRSQLAVLARTLFRAYAGKDDLALIAAAL